ncbi:hypothetical protein BU14_1995s0002, partial [Porphyra umbilicalis]
FPSTGAEQDAAEQDEGWWCTGRPLWPRLGLSPLSFAAAATRRRVSAAACAGSFARGVLAMLSLRDFLRRSAVLSLYRHALRTARRMPHGGDEVALMAHDEIVARRRVPSEQVDKLVADGHARLAQVRKLMDLTT